MVAIVLVTEMTSFNGGVVANVEIIYPKEGQYWRQIIKQKRYQDERQKGALDSEDDFDRK
jgi:hypothetical protein